MNFVDFSFWWTLTLIGVPCVVLRALFLRHQKWPVIGDRLLLLLVSLSLFYSASPSSFAVFGIELCLNYGAVVVMAKLPQRARRSCLALLVAGNIGVLAYFKYLTFFAVELFGLGNEVGLSGSQAIPPGISFYTFQMIAFAVDSTRKPHVRLRFVDYLNFTAFFPQIVAGPIERGRDLLPQLENFRFKFKARAFDIGMRWLSLGFFFKLFLGNTLAPFVDHGTTTNPFVIATSAFCFGLRIYFDFAGYSFIAVGIARILGVRLTVNFRAPYTSTSIREFWQRWHITLSRWFRDYLYIPLGGGRVRWAFFNTLIVFTISGLWHGAGWNFVGWGAVHGLALILSRYWKRSLPAPLGWCLTLLCVMFGWLLFMEPDSAVLSSRLVTLVTPSSYASSVSAVLPTLRLEQLVFTIVVGLSVLVLVLERLSIARGFRNEYHYLLTRPVALLLMFITIVGAPSSHAQFIYFAF